MLLENLSFLDDLVVHSHASEPEHIAKELPAVGQENESEMMTLKLMRIHNQILHEGH